ncbi:MAG: methyltransferase [Propionibacteriaceae bacterium]|nr:methyltransferase [Propionibacteriaceae bacterium]
MLNRDAARALATRLAGAGYTLDGVTARLGTRGTDALARNTTLAARDALGSDADAQATLVRLFLLQDAVPEPSASAALGDLDALARAGILDRAGDGVRAGVVIRPHAASGADLEFDGWLAHDPLPNLDGQLGRSRPDYVLGPSPASTTLAQMTPRTPVAGALDLGTGCGIQSLLLAQHAERVVATDLNPRAVAVADLTAGLNGIDLDLRTGSLYEPVAGERFDLIVTNPPYVMSPPTAQRLVYREGTETGDELVRRVVVEGAAHLAEGGTLQVLGNWAITSQPWEERLRGWVDQTGCDALVLQRELLDPYEYIEVWLADAGLLGTDEYAPRYRAWVDYFDHLGITGVGMGWISLHNSGRATPDVVLQEWPHAVHQPLGEAFVAHQHGVTAATVPDADLLGRAWRLDARVDVETLGRPGEEDPEHIVYRQRYGFGRAVEVDTALGAVLGASDGELTAGQLIAAVADLLDVDPDALAAEIVPRLRELIREGYLT